MKKIFLVGTISLFSGLLCIVFTILAMLTSFQRTDIILVQAVTGSLLCIGSLLLAYWQVR
jgi:hypothetical protein